MRKINHGDMSKECTIDAKLVQCKCPYCEKVYTRILNWTGNGMPRYFCPSCMIALGERLTVDIEEYNYLGGDYGK